MAGPQHYDDLPMNWVGDWAGRRAMLTPRRVALYDPAAGRRYTYAQMNERANRVGHWLRESLGLEKGDKICFISRNRVEPVDLYLAAGKCGFILAPLSYRLTKRELDDLLARIEPQVIFYEDVFAELAASLDLPKSVRDSIVIDDEGSRYKELLAAEPVEVNRPLSLADTFLYIHTGGTTATPKICVVPHRQMVWNSVELVIGSGGSMGQARELITFPLFHIGGWNTLTPIYHSGGYSVLLRQFDPGQVLELIEAEQISHIGAVEAMLQVIGKHPRFAETSLDSLAGITTAGAPCSPAAMRPFWDRGVPVTQAYGLTEAGPSNFVNAGIDESLDQIWEHNASIGRPFFHCDYKIVDPQTREEVAVGEPGVLCLRSMHNFQEYLRQPERTDQLFLEGGWVYSGDLARVDADGYVYIVGRADNMFISGGENVSPEEIEQVLSLHSAVSQVAVVAVPDPRWGQVAMAVIVPKSSAKPGSEELSEYCRANLAAYKVPRRFEFIEALPLTGAGKIDRNRILAEHAKREQ